MKSVFPVRNPWPVAIIGFFIVFGVFIGTFIVWAVSQKQDLVAENYYEKEVRFQQQLDRMNRTQPLAGTTRVAFDAALDCIVVTLPASQVNGASGRIHLYRPSNAKLDHEVPLTINPDGTQRVDAKPLAAGLWKIRVEWSAQGQDYFFDQPVVVN